MAGRGVVAGGRGGEAAVARIKNEGREREMGGVGRGLCICRVAGGWFCSWVRIKYLFNHVQNIVLTTHI
jgi:hypothetical protein